VPAAIQAPPWETHALLWQQPLKVLDKPWVSTSRAQGFGLGLGMAPEGSALVVGVAGCFTGKGARPPTSCPVFSAAAAVAPMAAASGGSGVDALGEVVDMDIFWLYRWDARRAAVHPAAC